MSTTTLLALREGVSKAVGDWLSGTTTDAGSQTTAADTSLANYKDDYFNGWYLLMTSGDDSGFYREVTDFTQSGGVITTIAFASSTGSGKTYELHRYLPDYYTRALNDAAQDGYPAIQRKILDDTLISGNWLSNGGFEDWSAATTIYNWAAVGSATFAKRTTIYDGRLYGLTMPTVTPGGANGGIKQSLSENVNLAELYEHSVTFRAMLNTTTSTPDATLRITDDDGTTSQAMSVTTNKWELVTVTDTIAAASDAVTFDCISPGNLAFYIENARVIGPAIYRYWLPSFVKRISKVELQTNGYSDYICDDSGMHYPAIPLPSAKMIYDGSDRYLYIPETLPTEQKIRITGSGTLSVLSSDTDTVEMDGPELRLLVMLAAAKLHESLAGIAAGELRERYLGEAERFNRKFQERLNTVGLASPATIPYMR